MSTFSQIWSFARMLAGLPLRNSPEWEPPVSDDTAALVGHPSTLRIS
jgi:hypothetical protein